jgi:hypothetical protein
MTYLADAEDAEAEKRAEKESLVLQNILLTAQRPPECLRQLTLFAWQSKINVGQNVTHLPDTLQPLYQLGDLEAAQTRWFYIAGKVRSTDGLM